MVNYMNLPSDIKCFKTHSTGILITIFNLIKKRLTCQYHAVWKSIRK